MRRNRLVNSKFKKKDVLILILAIAVIFEAVLILRLLPKKEKPAAVLPHKDKIAIVIDDWGYNKKNINFIKEINIPITLSILPQLNYSRKIAEIARKNNQEVIIHLPLEPHSDRNVGLEKGVILTNMKKEEINKIFKKAFESVPYSKGVSNHMGSKATEDKGLMKILFKQFKKSNLYFLDSLVTANSICQGLAGKMKVKFAKRDIFLDNELNVDYIKNQLRLLVAKAKKNGSAIGIGHDRTLTLKVIKDFAAEIKKENIEFVFLSDLIK